MHETLPQRGTPNTPDDSPGRVSPGYFFALPPSMPLGPPWLGGTCSSPASDGGTCTLRRLGCRRRACLCDRPRLVSWPAGAFFSCRWSPRCDDMGTSGPAAVESPQPGNKWGPRRTARLARDGGPGFLHGRGRWLGRPRKPAGSCLRTRRIVPGPNPPLCQVGGHALPGRCHMRRRVKADHASTGSRCKRRALWVHRLRMPSRIGVVCAQRYGFIERGWQHDAPRRQIRRAMVRR